MKENEAANLVEVFFMAVVRNVLSFFRGVVLFFILCLFPQAVSLADKVSDNAEAIDFVRDVEPIFKARCISCHGPEKQKNGLRVDRKRSLLQGGDYGPAVVPGDTVKSVLFQAVSGADPDLKMPPKREPLTAEEVAVIRLWIEQGAHWPEDRVDEASAEISSSHWSFQPIERPSVPAVKDSEWIRSPIDCFVLAKLREKGVQPSPPADRRTLIRRLSLDLTGLPPSPEEVDDFVNDRSPYAYERLVNRLLASPHFGERWGRHWLDLARYADSDGYEKDLPRPHAWRYRHWVIDAINRDLPYDQFVIEQIAGDLLPTPSVDQLVATGFHRNTLTNREGGIDPEEDRVKQNVDRTNTTASVFLGLTMACAQCHSHKYDPLTQREYFQMYAFFDQTIEKDIPAPLQGEIQQYRRAKAACEAEYRELRKKVDEYRKELEARLPEWEAKLDLSGIRWEIFRPTSMVSEGGAEFELLEDGSILVSGFRPDFDSYTLVTNTDLEGITAVKIEALTHPSLPKTGPGRAHHGNFILSELTVYAARKGRPNAAQPVRIREGRADHHEKNFDVSKAFDGDLSTGWSIEAWKGLNQNREALFILDEDVANKGGTTLRIKMDFQYGTGHALGRFRILLAKGDRENLNVPAEIPEILAVAPEKRTQEQKDVLVEYFGKTFDTKMRELMVALESHERLKPKPPDTMAQTIAQNPKDVTTRIHIRGDFLRPGEVVQPDTPAVLPLLKPRGGKPDRLDLARWLVDPENPLSPRVEVNRIWHHLFGQGLVVTTEDFGVRGDLPSHPELLDWLASEFIARGWSVKELIREIVRSSTYRQSSRIRPDLLDRDPKNRWLARQNRFRVEAEIVRDMALAASGLLNPMIGGMSIRPPIPEGVASLGYANSVKWKTDQDENRYRRGLYIFFQRTVPYPMLMTFDCPDSTVTCLRRTVSNTPLQALTLLNDPVFVECAEHLGKRLVAECGAESESDRIRHAFRLCLGRDPDEEEIEIASSLVRKQSDLFKENPEEAEKILQHLDLEETDKPETAAWVALARVMINLDEFMTRE